MEKLEPPSFTTIVAEDLSPEQAQSLMRAIIEETPLVIYAKDLQHRFLLSNRQHATLIGLKPSEILGRTDLEIFGEEAAEVEAISTKVLSSKRPFAQEFQLTLQDAEHSFLETIFPLFGADGVMLGLGGIATDITERRALESALRDRAEELEIAMQKLEAAQAELVQQQKMAALGQLVAGLAHEVNSPLGAALTASTFCEQIVEDLGQRLQTGRLSRGAMNESLSSLQEAAQLTVGNLKRSVQLLTSFQRVAANQTQTIIQEGKLDEWIDDVLLSLSPLMRRHHVVVRREVDVSNARVRFAASELQQVLTNLLINAATHAYPPLSIAEVEEWVKSPDLQSGREIVLRVREQEDALSLCVEDFGFGVSEEFQPHIFDPFFTTRRGRGGTGLGLSITYSLVTETFGGTIRMQTRLGEGSAFNVHLPWRQESLWKLPRRADELSGG